MNEKLQSFSSKLEEKIVKPIESGFMSFVSKHPEVFCLSLLALLCFIFLFMGINFYPLIDVDETRYAIMARDMVFSFDWNNLMFNGEHFLEKPPLYFWLVGSSIKLFGVFNEFAVRLPIAIVSTFLIFSTYFFGKKIISRKFGMMSALILLSSVFFLIFSHIAILDMVLTVFMTSAIYCGFLTHFCQEEKFKKYLWWYFYMFIGVGFLAKGILALVIPVTIIFAYNMLTKTLNEFFKPIHIIPGILIFFAITVPWHFIMYSEHGNKFVYEYFILHHFARFIDSANIGRERPFYFFIPIFLLGFLPWTIIFIAFLGEGFKKLVAKFEAAEGALVARLCKLTYVQNNEQKLILFSTLYFLIVFLIFSISSTKLPTYILPVFPAAALLTGYFWWYCDENKKHEKLISVSTEILATIFIIAATGATIAYFLIPFDLQEKIEPFRAATICGVYLIGILLLLRMKIKNVMSIFGAYVFIMVFIISVAVSHVFNLVYAGGENEIVKYSGYAQGRTSKLVTFDFAVKPSAMIRYQGKVHFLTDPDFEKLDETLKYEGGPTFVIIKNINMEDSSYRKNINKRLKFVDKDERYSLYVKELAGRRSK